MADEKPAENTESPEAAPAEGKKKSGMTKIVILIAVAMIGEAGLFYFLGIGSGNNEAAATEENAAEEEKTEDEPADELVEVEVHSFNVTNSIAATDTIVHIAFKLHALVAADQKAEFDASANDKNKARVREAVEKIARSATLEDLEDYSLSTVRRLLREEINKVLRQSYVVDVVLSDYKTMKQ